ncbi:hypothetical protein [Bosea beijingensis]|uniref:hypothetical protein n=1 Tax=Bosea beijingensis TaxID=3068632 RepID=UPI0027421BD7|nr:hypothetical protein [Bosea sp. REN20]
MPHEADSTGLSTLLWLICIYWNLVWFTQQLTSLGQAGNGEPAEQTAGDQAQQKPDPRALSAIASRTAAAMREIFAAGWHDLGRGFRRKGARHL